MKPELLLKAITTTRDPSRRHRYTCDYIRHRLDDSPGWVLLYSAVLDGQIVLVRDNQIQVEAPFEILNLPRFTRDEVMEYVNKPDGVKELTIIYELKNLLDATYARKQ